MSMICFSTSSGGMRLYCSSNARVSSGILGGSSVYQGTFLEYVAVVPGTGAALSTTAAETAAVVELAILGECKGAASVEDCFVGRLGEERFS